MQPQDPLEVLFCDLCNTSVPAGDVGTGKAVRHAGKTIGGCCLPSLRGAAVSAPARDAAVPSIAGPVAHHEARLLPFAIAILAAVAAATLFLEYRISQTETRVQVGGTELAEQAKAQAEVVQSISVALDGVARRADLDDMAKRLLAIEQQGQRTADQVQSVAKDHARALESVHAAVQVLQESDRQQAGLPAMLTEQQQSLARLAVALAELRAQPRSTPIDSAPQVEAAAPMTPTPGIAPELAHHIQKLKDADAATRFEAVDELLRSKDAAVLEHLLPMAKDADTFVRRLTVEGLKDFKKPAVVDVLIVALADPEEIVADTAWRSLKELTGQKLPFEAAAGRDARARAQQKWKEWWDKNRDAFGT